MLKINLFATLLFTALLGFGTQAWSQCTLTPANPALQTVCQGSAITSVSFTSSGGNGALFSGLPAGVTGSYNATTGDISISGTPTVAGNFNYSINLTGCSGGATATASGTLVVTPFNTLTFVSAISTVNQILCAGSAMDSVRIRVTGATGFSSSGLPDGVTATQRNDSIIIGGIPLNGVAGLPWANDTLLNYTITLTGGCTGGTNSLSGSLRVRNNNPIALQVGSNNAQTVCISSAISNIVYTTGRANGVIFSGLPTGVSGSFDSLNRTVTISGTPSVRGTFAYSVLVNGGCTGSPNLATGTITVQGYTVAVQPSSAPVNQTVCLGGTIQAISYTTSGATSIGTATGLPTGLSANWASNVLTITGTVSATATPGTYNFSVPMSGLTGCPGVNATGQIVVTGNRTVGAASSTPTLCIGSALPASITHATTIATGIGIPTGLPAGCTAVFSGNATAGTVTISGTPTAIGVYNYTIPMVGCGTANASGTITVQGYSVAVRPSSAPVNQTVCLGGTIQAISYTTSGATSTGTATGLPTGLSANWASNVLTITGTVSATATPGTYNFSVPMSGLTGCPGVNATGQIVVTGNRTVGAASSTPTLCIGSALPASITHATTIATGIGIPTGLPAGCTAVFSGNATAGTVTISGTPTAIGVYNYTIPMVGCGTANASGTITVQGYSVAVRPSSAPVNQTVCLGGTIQAISYATSGATGIGAVTGLPNGISATWASNILTISGTVDPTETPGTFNFSAPMDGLSGCPGVNATGSIVVTGNRTVGAASSTPVLCIGSALDPAGITHATTIATGIGIPTGLPAGCTAVFSGNATAGTVTISGTPTAIGVYNYTIPMVGCGTANASGTITVQGYSVAVRPSSAPVNQTVCLGGTIQTISYTTSGATGIGTATGLPTGLSATWASNVLTISGTVSATATPGTYNFSVPMTGLPSCPNVNATGSIVVRPYNSLSLTSGSATSNLCIGNSITSVVYTTTGFSNGIVVTGLPQGISYSYDSATRVTTISGTPSVRGTFVYRITALGGCTQASGNTLTGTITVNGNTILLGKKDPNLSTPDVVTNIQTRCVLRPIQPIVFTTTGATGVTLDPALPANSGLTASFNSGTGVFTISGTPSSSFTYNGVVQMTGGCTTNQLQPSVSLVVLDSNTISLSSATGTDNQSVPRNTAMTNITYSTLGATGARVRGLPSGVFASWVSNTVTISGTPVVSGTYQYIVDMVGGCPVGKGNSDTGTITVTNGGSLIGNGYDVNGINNQFTGRTTQNSSGISTHGRLHSNQGFQSELSVYPVPGVDYLFVRGLDAMRDAVVTVLDQTGRVVGMPNNGSIESTTGEYKLDLNPLANGVYFLRVQSELDGTDRILRFSVKH